MPKRFRVAILDDYLGVAMTCADWSLLDEDCTIACFTHHLDDTERTVSALRSFDVVCTMRERTAMPRSVLERLPALKLVTITGRESAALDIEAATALGIVVSNTTTRGPGGHGTAELTLGLMLSLARHLPWEAGAMRSGGWQRRLGNVLAEKTLGLIGLGTVGARVARFGTALGMNVIAWSPNLTEERARAAGAALVGQETLFRCSDIVSLHLALGESTRHIVGPRELSLMKPSAYLVNTARAELIEPDALFQSLQRGEIAGAALDVFEREPLPDDDPLRSLENVVLTPHLGYAVGERMRDYYLDTAANVLAFVKGCPTRVLNPAVLNAPNLRAHVAM